MSIVAAFDFDKDLKTLQPNVQLLLLLLSSMLNELYQESEYEVDPEDEGIIEVSAVLERYLTPIVEAMNDNDAGTETTH